MKNWRAVNPRTSEAEVGHSGFFTATTAGVEITRGARKKIHNNYINTNGVSVFAQESELVEDVTITRNTLVSDPRDMAGGPSSIGLYYPKRHLFEMKQGKRFLLEGNTFDGNWSDWTPCGPSIALSPRGGSPNVNQVSDVTIRNNTFHNTASGIQVIGVDDNAEAKIAYMTQRVRIDNNLAYDVDNRKWASKPSAVGGPGVCGYAFQALLSVEDLTITHNTAFDMRGSQPQFFSYQGGRSEGVVVTNNLFSHNHDNSAGGLSPFHTITGLTPPITGNIKQAWDQYFRSGSDFRDNVVIPGVKNTSILSNYDSTIAFFRVTPNPNASLTMRALLGITCIGSGLSSETANKRIAAVKFFDPNGRDLRLRPDSPSKAGSRSEGLDAGADVMLSNPRREKSATFV